MPFHFFLPKSSCLRVNYDGQSRHSICLIVVKNKKLLYQLKRFFKEISQERAVPCNNRFVEKVTITNLQNMQTVFILNALTWVRITSFVISLLKISRISTHTILIKLRRYPAQSRLVFNNFVL
jgi:hypothetical protein